MRRVRARVVFGLAVALAFLVRPAGTTLAEDDPGEAAFLESLERARAIGESGRGAEGLRLVTSTLEEHAGKDYARAKRVFLEDLVRRLAFRAECPPPDPQSVVKGSLKRFKSATGDLEIHYAAGKPTDFEERDGTLVFPARFAGPFTVTIRGLAYPRAPEDAPLVQVGMEEDRKTHRVQGWAVGFGVPTSTQGSQQVWVPARILRLDGDEKKMLVEAKTPAVPGAPYRLDVKVGRAVITPSVDGKAIGNAPKPDGVFGWLQVRVKGWSEIVVQGIVEPSWIVRKLDEIVAKKREDFDGRFDAKKHLPKWVYEAPKRAAPSGASPPADSPPPAEDVPAEHREAVLAARALLAKEQPLDALLAVRAMREKGAPDAVTAMLMARAHLALDELPEALVEVDKAIAAGRKGFEPLMTRGAILLRLGRDEEAAVALEGATSQPEAPTGAFEFVTRWLLLGAQLDAARRVSEEAARRGLRSKDLDTLSRVLVKAQTGPEWPKTYEWKSTNYHVSSDIDIETCKAAAAVLEDALTTFRIYVKPLKAERKRLYRVFLFGGQAGYERYFSDVTQGGRVEHTAGLYTPVLKQLLIWNVPSRDEMMRTVRHEGFHQYLDRLLPDPPVWLNEGLATYYETMERVGGELKTDRPRADLVALLKATPPLPLAEFFAESGKAFYANGMHSYAQAWLVVHMMRHGNGKHRDLYRALLTRLETESGRDAVRAVFPADSLRALDSDLRAHLASLSKN